LLRGGELPPKSDETVARNLVFDEIAILVFKTREREAVLAVALPPPVLHRFRTRIVRLTNIGIR
jgi:hypothetical protein